MAFGNPCTSSIATFYSNCPALNAGCYLYELVSGQYIPVPRGSYSDGDKCAIVSTDDGLIESYSTCATIWRLQISYDCVTGIYDGFAGSLFAYGYFPDDPSFVPNGSFWYQENSCQSEGCKIWNVWGFGAGPVTIIDPTKAIIPLKAVNYDQTSVITVCTPPRTYTVNVYAKKDLNVSSGYPSGQPIENSFNVYYSFQAPNISQLGASVSSTAYTLVGTVNNIEYGDMLYLGLRSTTSNRPIGFRMSLTFTQTRHYGTLLDAGPSLISPSIGGFEYYGAEVQVNDDIDVYIEALTINGYPDFGRVLWY